MGLRSRLGNMHVVHVGYGRACAQMLDGYRAYGCPSLWQRSIDAVRCRARLCFRVVAPGTEHLGLEAGQRISP